MSIVRDKENTYSDKYFQMNSTTNINLIIASFSAC